MAKTTITQVTDDIDGSKDAQEVTFSFRGIDYTIDLGKRNLAALEKALKPYIEAGAKVPSSARSRRSVKSGTSGQDLAAVRKWAKSKGIDVSSRGRIPRTVLEQYEARN